MSEDKELTEEELQNTVGGLRTRRTSEAAGTTSSINLDTTEYPQQLSDPEHGGLTPGGKIR